MASRYPNSNLPHVSPQFCASCDGLTISGHSELTPILSSQWSLNGCFCLWLFTCTQACGLHTMTHSSLEASFILAQELGSVSSDCNILSTRTWDKGLAVLINGPDANSSCYDDASGS